MIIRKLLYEYFTPLHYTFLDFASNISEISAELLITNKICSLQVISEDKKVAVRFLDYGNTSTESIENIRKLPEAAATFPLLAKMVALDDVPEVPVKDVKFENK